jgi:hypothetical protein
LHLVETRPQGILDNLQPERLPAAPALNVNAYAARSGSSWWWRLFGRGQEAVKN